ncbi:MAG TPA: aspartate/glutamate racemase family protein [Acidobacteriaceae bacterium]
MNKTVYALHTGPVLVDVLKQLFSELLPEARLVNIVDDGLLTDVRAAGGLTPALRRRTVGYGLIAEASGADAILNCCSSVGEAADVLATLVTIPLVKIDDKMAEAAVSQGARIAVLATVATTLDPTERLIHRKAEQAGRKIKTTRFLADSAFDALLSGNTQQHDGIVKAEIERAMTDHDVVVLAQGSMARLVPQVQSVSNVPVLSSPRLGVLALREALELA